MLLDLTRFIKIASRMHSENDHEALIAARQATSMLVAAGGHWSQVNVSISPKTKPHQPDNRCDLSIEGYLAFVEARLGNLPEQGREFFEGLNLFYEERGYLSDKQQMALIKLYKQVSRSRK